jgi:hypothetical protein
MGQVLVVAGAKISLSVTVTNLRETTGATGAERVLQSRSGSAAFNLTRCHC